MQAEITLSTIEAFAHYMRGATALFFIFWCCKLYFYRRRNRMMMLLFIATVFLSFSQIKDAIFLIDQWKNSYWLNDLVVTIDLVFIPLISAFFLEATRPGIVTAIRLVTVIVLQAAFVPTYLLCSDDAVIWGALSLAFAYSVLTISCVLVFATRYHKYIAVNYSYNENIDVTWVTVSCIVYFLALFIYAIAFDNTTWLSEALYNVFSIVLWTFLFVFARRHRVLRVLTPKNKDREVPVSEPAKERAPISRDDMLASRLHHLMANEKAYLNPKIALGEVAVAIGTNKTYLSDYFNKTLGTTFYDYINSYRIAEACRIIDSMPKEGRTSMAVVAEKSGFNSLSSFNRYFVKVKGVSPKNYYDLVLKATINKPDDSEQGQ